MITTADDEVPERNGCRVCGQKMVIVGGKPIHLSEWLARRPNDDDPWVQP